MDISGPFFSVKMIGQLPSVPLSQIVQAACKHLAAVLRVRELVMVGACPGYNLTWTTQQVFRRYIMLHANYTNPLN